MRAEHVDQSVLGGRLKDAREYRGFSQEEVALHLDVPRTAISLMESGSRRVGALELNRLAKLYQTTMEYLTGDFQESTQPGSIQLVARAAADLSTADHEEVLRFVEFLRSRKSDEPA